MIKSIIVLFVIVYVLTFSSNKQTLKQKTDMFWIPALGGNLGSTQTSASLTGNTNSIATWHYEIFTCFSKHARPAVSQQHNIQNKRRLCFVDFVLGVWQRKESWLFSPSPLHSSLVSEASVFYDGSLENKKGKAKKAKEVLIYWCLQGSCGVKLKLLHSITFPRTQHTRWYNCIELDPEGASNSTEVKENLVPMSLHEC